MNIKALALACLVAFFLGFGSGLWLVYERTVLPLQAQLAAEKAKPPVVKTEVKTVTDTKLQYVPGETVYLPTPTPDNPNATTATKLDGKIEIGKPTFTYTLNGKPGQFTKTDDEKYVFDKNMVTLTQAATVAIKLEVPTVDNTRRNAIGPYATTESYGLILSRETDSQRFMLLAGKKWDKDNGRGYEAGAAWQVKF
jgi:hypothetical protein